MALEEIKKKFGGKWKLDRSENFEDFLKEVGANVVMRKLAATSSPEMTISVEGDVIKIVIKSLVMTREENIKLGEEYESEMRGVKLSNVMVYEDGKLKIKSDPITSGYKAQQLDRDVVDGELVQVIKCGDVVCTRIFKKIE
ncbi:sodium/calcium exchanger regulatory protein 1-like [Gigantopelta aegis]|uniref:sodium/calcium exchanger regulatory protein 1-like n=1 Tax=Gigantopelta aegis TaxID=1735272 RepID=UPI001B888B44|nr:sodium/calcium exchanger regulatory protein 1-like [Gigantopelta aegis]